MAQTGNIAIQTLVHDPRLSIEGQLTGVEPEIQETGAKGEVGTITSSSRSFVRGRILVRNVSTDDASVDIRRYRLVFKKELSSVPYIDSVAHFIIREQLLRPGEQVEFNVYWVFQGLLLDRTDLTKMELTVVQK